MGSNPYNPQSESGRFRKAVVDAIETALKEMEVPGSMEKQSVMRTSRNTIMLSVRPSSGAPRRNFDVTIREPW